MTRSSSSYGSMVEDATTSISASRPSRTSAVIGFSLATVVGVCVLGMVLVMSSSQADQEAVVMTAGQDSNKELDAIFHLVNAEQRDDALQGETSQTALFSSVAKAAARQRSRDEKKEAQFQQEIKKVEHNIQTLVQSADAVSAKLSHSARLAQEENKQLALDDQAESMVPKTKSIIKSKPVSKQPTAKSNNNKPLTKTRMAVSPSSTRRTLLPDAAAPAAPAAAAAAPAAAAAGGSASPAPLASASAGTAADVAEGSTVSGGADVQTAAGSGGSEGTDDDEGDDEEPPPVLWFHGMWIVAFFACMVLGAAGAIRITRKW